MLRRSPFFFTLGHDVSLDRLTLACTLCHTAIAEHVRHGILGHGLWFTIAVGVLPFLTMLAIALLVHGRTVVR